VSVAALTTGVSKSLDIVGRGRKVMDLEVARFLEEQISSLMR
jgi:hypothetical protein